MTDRALVLFGHGARDPGWALPFRSIQRAVTEQAPEIEIECAFLEHMTPTLPEAIAALAARGRTRITIAPLFIAQGGHLKQDLPRMLDAIRAEHRGISLRLLPPLGEVGTIITAIAAWLAAETQ